MLLSVDTISKSFGDLRILDRLSLTVDAGETVALTGESGSGKSTLLHMIAGLEPIDNGQVTLGGVKVKGLSDQGQSNLRRLSIGIVFQQFNLIPSLNVADNITFQARLAGKKFGLLRLESLIESLGLSDQLSKYPEQLSGGQQQRVAIARAILPAPKLVLADEPTGNLDEATSDAVIDALLAQTKLANSGLLLVTHSERLANRADRRVHLSHGVLQ